MTSRFTITAFTVILLCACGNHKEESGQAEVTDSGMEYNYVDTMSLSLGVFNRQLVCNGRLRAILKSDLPMPASGYVTTINVTTGSHVVKGQILATTDDESERTAVEKAERELEKARIDLIDKLIGMGYDEDLSQVPTDVLRRAETTSGYYAAQLQLREAQQKLRDCCVRAPFSGTVANIDYKPNEKATKFCTLIDDSWFDVEFSVLEAELNVVSSGQRVVITPFVNGSRPFNGYITEINPEVTDKGLVKIRARVENKPDDGLIDGMNVHVVVERTEGDMYVVPKSAVVERDGYHVVFIYRNGRAVWTYVDIVHSNLTSYAITGSTLKETTIKEGDIIIISGNLNLADNTPVKPRAATDSMIE